MEIQLDVKMSYTGIAHLIRNNSILDSYDAKKDIPFTICIGIDKLPNDDEYIIRNDLEDLDITSIVNDFIHSHKKSITVNKGNISSNSETGSLNDESIQEKKKSSWKSDMRYFN